MRIDKTAITAGIISFVAIYALGGMIIIFSLVLLSNLAESEQVMMALRIGGYLALGFPAYVAARAARDHGLMHAFIMGLIQALAVVLLMMFTFSFEGTLQQQVVSRMLPVFGAVVLLSLLAGGLARWRDRRQGDQRRQGLGR